MKIVTISNDGTNVAFGLDITAKNMTTIAIISFIMGVFFLSFNGLIIDRNKFPRGSKSVNVNSLDVYKNEDSDMEHLEPTVLYTTKL